MLWNDWMATLILQMNLEIHDSSEPPTRGMKEGGGCCGSDRMSTLILLTRIVEYCYSKRPIRGMKVFREWGDVNSNTRNKSGTMPLSIAAWNVDEEVVKRLLELFDVNSNTADKYGETPLF